jgi:hypothetical protein
LKLRQWVPNQIEHLVKSGEMQYFLVIYIVQLGAWLLKSVNCGELKRQDDYKIAHCF